MNYKVWIPIHGRKWTEKQKEEMVVQLKRAKADFVLLSYHRMMCSEEMQNAEIEIFTDTRDYLTSHGFEVGAWMAPTIGYGMPYYGDNAAATEFTHIMHLRADKVVGSPGMEIDKYDFGLKPGETPGAFCPLDDRFVEEFLKTVRNIANLGVKTIMFEDDYTLGGGKFWNDIGCACDKHMEIYCKRIGKKMTRAEVADKVFNGGRSKYRDLWMEIQKETLVDFTRKIERAAHEIDPTIRMGLSANGSSFEMEGVTLDELEMILAGDTKPFLRLTGAPYWKQMLTLAPCIEAIRLQTYWCDSSKIDLITEGDTYPRPRYWVPSALLEHYDMILRADEDSHGALKYMLDYNSSPNYETGYIDRHARNERHYEEIERRFWGKKTVGLHLYEKPMTFRDRIFDEDISIDNFRKKCGGYLPLAEQWMLCDNSIPICYKSDSGPMMVIGENAQYVTEDELRRGAIIDAQAAKRLMARGIDIGVESMERVEKPFAQHFKFSDDYTLASLPFESVFYNMKLKDGAEVDSEFVICPPGLGVIPGQGINERPRFPGCVRYENAEGMKFVILPFIPETVATTNEWIPGIFRNYRFQKLLGNCYEWLACKPLPAMCYGAPQLYTLCKKDDSSMAVGLWNIFADEVITPEIELDGEYSSVDFYNCSGRLDGNRVILDNDIAPYGFAFFTVNK